MDEQSNSKIAFKNVSTNLVLQAVIIISGFIIPKLLIGTFGSATYGLVASITQFLALITLLQAGIGPVIKVKLYKCIAEKDKNKILLVLKDAAKFFRIIGYIFIVYSILLCFIYPLINDEFDKFLTISLIIVMTVGTLMEYFFGLVYNIFLQADKKLFILNGVQIFCYIFNILLVVLLIYCGANIIMVKIANTIAFGIKPVFQAYYVKRKLKLRISEAKGEYKIDNKFDGLSQHVAFVINSSTDVTVLTIFTNLTTVSVYAIYNLINTAVQNFVAAFVTGMDAIFGDLFVRNEKERLRNSFQIYEFVYYTLSTIIFLCTLVLIVPFISVYMRGVTDANYIQPVFSIVFILAGFVLSARTIYSGLIYSVGHFKQTNFVAWIEAITNITLSIILVFKFGLIGVAIGTLVASSIRLSYFMFYAAKVVLNRSHLIGIKWIITCAIEIVACLFAMHFNILTYSPTNYFEWAIYAFIILLIMTIFVLIINYIFNKEAFKNCFSFLKAKIKLKKEA